jgi:crotonobetaine/carnitine-CoA ligase
MITAVPVDPTADRAPARRHPLAPAERTVPALLERRARERPDDPFVVAPGGTRTAAELRDAVARRAGGLRDAGVAPGDRVLLMSSNRIELLELMLACAWSGAIAVPLNTAARGDGLRHMVTTAAARLAIVEDDLRGALDDAGGHDHVWSMDDAPAADEPLPAHPVTLGDPATILYTSGTTGPAKGVVGPHGQVCLFASYVCDLLEITEDDVLFTCLPLFHVNAWCCFVQALISGARYHLTTRFSASRFWDQAIEAGATVTYLLGAMIPILLRRPPSPQDRAHRIRTVNGMAPPPDVAKAALDRFGLAVAECYASTEVGCALGAAMEHQRPGWMGVPMPGYEVRVVDELDAEVPDGEPGELTLRAGEPAAILSGYFGMPEATVAAWRNGWFHTGDQVVRDADGYLRFVDRLKDAIRRRGENISSFEVESALLSHPGVADAAAFAVPSDLGEEDDVMAAVVPRQDAQLDPLELARWCEPRLAYFAIPRYIDVVDALPLTENGKVRKAVLRDRGVTPTTVDLEAAGHRAARPSR